MKRRVKHIPLQRVSVFLSLIAIFSWALLAQDATQDTPASPLHQDHILGVIPNYQTVTNPHKQVQALTVKEKFGLFAKETLDPFVPMEAAIGAVFSQTDNDDPKYGQGPGPYAQRFGAACADIASQNFFSDAVMASLLREDPRYFRMGPEFGFWRRVGHALNRTVITRTDAGKDTFNYAGIIGMGMGIALSNAYYPPASVNGTEMGKRFGTSLASAGLLNILPEFWPDIRQKFFHRKPKP